MTEHRVTMVERPAVRDRIVRIGTGTEAGSASRWWRPEDVARAMARGERFFIQGETSGRRSEIHLTSAGLRSAPDAAEDNNLETLPDRNAGAGGRAGVAYPGDDLQAIIDSLPAAGASLLLTAGEYTLASPVNIVGRRRFTLVGQGWGTHLRFESGNLQLRDCVDVTVSDMTVELVTAPAPSPPIDRSGAVTVIGGGAVTVSDCLLACPDGDAGPAGCVAANAAGQVGARLLVRRCRLVTGSGQVGVECRDARDVAVVDCRIGPSADATSAHARELEERLVAQLRSGLNDAADDTPAARLLDSLSPGRGSALRASEDEALRTFARSLLSGEGVRSLSADARGALDALLADAGAAAHGIAISGHLGRVLIAGNLMEDLAQGVTLHGVVHDGYWPQGGPARVVGNEIRLRVSHTGETPRTALHATGFWAIDVVDNVLYGYGDPVYGITIDGVMGDRVLVRGAHIGGWVTVGVRVRPAVPNHSPRLWHVRETHTFGQDGVDLGEGVTGELNSYNPE